MHFLKNARNFQTLKAGKRRISTETSTKIKKFLISASGVYWSRLSIGHKVNMEQFFLKEYFKYCLKMPFMYHIISPPKYPTLPSFFLFICQLLDTCLDTK